MQILKGCKIMKFITYWNTQYLKKLTFPENGKCCWQGCLFFTCSFLESLYSLMIWSTFSTIPASDTHMIRMFSFTNTASILRLTKSWSNSDCCKKESKYQGYRLLKGTNCQEIYSRLLTKIPQCLCSGGPLPLWLSSPFPFLVYHWQPIKKYH